MTSLLYRTFCCINDSMQCTHELIIAYNWLHLFDTHVCLSVCLYVWLAYAYAREPYPKTSFLWTTGIGQAAAVWTRLSLQRYSVMRQCNIDPGSLTSASSDRSSWRTLCHKAVTEFEDARVAALVHKQAVRKFNAQPSSSLGVWPCDSCFRVCSSRIGLFAHQKTHW